MKTINTWNNQQMDILLHSILMANRHNDQVNGDDKIDVNPFTVNILWYVAGKES